MACFKSRETRFSTVVGVLFSRVRVYFAGAHVSLYFEVFSCALHTATMYKYVGRAPSMRVCFEVF